MTLDYLYILVVVALFSVLQTFFGLGLLVFGTPTLLLMGYDFVTTLCYLLPASFAISFFQILTARPNHTVASKYLYLLTLPGIIIGLWLTEVNLLASWTVRLVGGMLVLSAIIRLWPPSRNVLTIMMKRYSLVYHFLMGVVHGLTNLGGALLSILASGTHSQKESIRYMIAQYYLVFVGIQMMTLALFMGHFEILIANSATAVISTVVYFLTKNRRFISLSNPSYDVAWTLFIAAYGLLILLNY